MFPLHQWHLIRGAQGHLAAGLGVGADYVAAVGTPLYAPKSGIISRQYTGNEGGKWLWFTAPDGQSIQFAHLNTYVGGLRQVKEGELIAHTGNTGSITTGPHLHIQIIDQQGRRLDPEMYNWGSSISTKSVIIGGGDDVPISIEAGATIEAVEDGVELRTVPTDIPGRYERVGMLQRGNRAEVEGQTPDGRWVDVNAAGVYKGWAKLVDHEKPNFRVIYRKDVFEALDKANEGIDKLNKVILDNESEYIRDIDELYGKLQDKDDEIKRLRDKKPAVDGTVFRIGKLEIIIRRQK